MDNECPFRYTTFTDVIKSISTARIHVMAWVAAIYLLKISKDVSSLTHSIPQGEQHYEER